MQSAEKKSKKVSDNNKDSVTAQNQAPLNQHQANVLQ